MQFTTLLSFGIAVTLALTSPTPAINAANALMERDDAAASKASPISLTNIISVVEKPAKVKREAELLTTFINKVKKNEPGVLQFDLNLDKNSSQFLTYEVYKNQKAIDIHLNSSYLADLLEAENKEKLKRSENVVFFLDPVVKFTRN